MYLLWRPQVTIHHAAQRIGYHDTSIARNSMNYWSAIENTVYGKDPISMAKRLPKLPGQWSVYPKTEGGIGVINMENTEWSFITQESAQIF